MNAVTKAEKSNVTELKESGNIYARLAKARMKFHAKKLNKTGLNKFSNYTYFELADFLVFGLECLSSVGLVPVITYSKDIATMTVYDAHSDATFTITSPMASANLKGCHEIQNLGAVETYQRRYLWMTLLELVEGDPANNAPPAAELATAEQIAALHEYAETDLMTTGQKLWLEKASNTMTEEQAAYVLQKLREKEEAE